MSVHSIFKKLVNESVFAKKCGKTDIPDINEGVADGAVGSLTRNNIIPNIFGGRYLGLRVPSAMLPGKAMPFWDRIHFTYPFAGINGASNTAAIAARHGSESSFMRDYLIEKGELQSVKDILAMQVAQGTGIPSDVFVLFPRMLISSIGSKGTSKSMSLFNTKNLRDSYNLSLYPYNVQQALSVDTNAGKIYPDPSKKGGVVLRPLASGAQMSVGGMMYLDRLTKEDIMSLANLKYGSGGHEAFAEQFTGSSNPNHDRVGNILGSYMSGERYASDTNSVNPNFVNPIKNGNPNYGKFRKFAEENDFVSEDGNIDYMAIREWILEADGEEIVDRLIIPYLLMSPFERTYCWRKLTPDKEKEFAQDITLYKALNGQLEAKGGEEPSIDIEHVEFEPYDDSEEQSNDDVGESAMVFCDCRGDVNESEGMDASVGGVINKNGYMAIFDRAATLHHSTIVLKPTLQEEPLKRDDDRTITKNEGYKRTFVRVIFENTKLMDEDFEYCPSNADGIITSSSGVLDYSQIFNDYKDILDLNSPQKFKYERLVGYTISFKYDGDIERERETKRRKGLLNSYLESPNAVRLNETTTFDVIYVKTDKGNFIFTGYTNPNEGGYKYKPAVPPPDSIEQNRLYADMDSGLHSVIVHDKVRNVISYSYNKQVL